MRTAAGRFLRALSHLVACVLCVMPAEEPKSAARAAERICELSVTIGEGEGGTLAGSKRRTRTAEAEVQAQ